MTTTQVAKFANKDKVGEGLDLQTLLRTEVMLEFFADIGDVRWRKKATTLSLVAGDATKDLPDDFYAMSMIKLPVTGSTTDLTRGDEGLKYIGEDDSRVLQAEFNTTRGKPGAYYLVARTSDSSFRAIHFDCPCDAAYTAYYRYLRGPVFADNTTAVDLNTWIPEQFQMGLVKCLRKAILIDRVNQKDPRYIEAKGEYDTWIQTRIKPDLGRRSYVITVN